MNELNIPELEPSTDTAIDYSTCYAQPSIQLFNCDNLELMAKMEDNSVDVILTDPPYLYLKNQKLEREFDEQLFFSECKRILTENGFIVMFGRGTSFYRWNTMLADLGFNFKEEIIWDKSYCTSPLMAISRVHETISIHSKGKGIIQKVKIPYLEMKKNNPESIIQDIKRLRSIFTQEKSMKAVLDFCENNLRDKSDSWNANNLSISSDITKEDRCVSVVRSVKNGLNEKSIIRTDFCDKTQKNRIAESPDVKDFDRCVNVVQSVEFGLNEKSIIKQVRDHYSAIHPTQKPVRLIERLLALVIPKDKEPNEIVVADFFGGSFSTMEAVYNMGMQGISCEIDKEYFEAGKKRIESLPPRQTALFD